MERESRKYAGRVAHQARYGKDGFRRYNDLIKSLILALGLPRPRETLTIGSDLPGATVGGLTR
jgi:hypothetical protein